MSIFGLEIMGEEMKQVILAGNQLRGNLLTNIKAEDVNLGSVKKFVSLVKNDSFLVRI